MRFKYVPEIKPVVSYYDYVFGILKSEVVDSTGCFDSEKLFASIKDDSGEEDAELDNVLTSGNWFACGLVYEYPIIGGSIDELIIVCKTPVDKSVQQIGAIYQTMIGGGDDPGTLLALSLESLAEKMQPINTDRAGIIKNLAKIIVKP